MFILCKFLNKLLLWHIEKAYVVSLWLKHGLFLISNIRTFTMYLCKFEYLPHPKKGLFSQNSKYGIWKEISENSYVKNSLFNSIPTNNKNFHSVGAVTFCIILFTKLTKQRPALKQHNFFVGWHLRTSKESSDIAEYIPILFSGLERHILPDVLKFIFNLKCPQNFLCVKLSLCYAFSTWMYKLAAFSQ